MHRNLHWLADNDLASMLWSPDTGGGNGGKGGTGDPPEGDEDEDEDDEDDDDPPKAKSRTFTQDKLNRMMAREKSDGRKAGKRELLEELGVKDAQEAKSILEKYRNTQDEARTEAEKLAEQAKGNQAETDRLKAEAKRERIEAKVERQLLKANIKDGKETKALKLLDLDLDEDPSAEDIKDAVDALAEEFPDLFTSKSDDEDDEEEPPKKNRPTRVGDPGRPPRRQGKSDPASRARSRLEERHGRSLQRNAKS